MSVSKACASAEWHLQSIFSGKAFTNSDTTLAAFSATQGRMLNATTAIALNNKFGVFLSSEAALDEGDTRAFVYLRDLAAYRRYETVMQNPLMADGMFEHAAIDKMAIEATQHLRLQIMRASV